MTTDQPGGRVRAGRFPLRLRIVSSFVATVSVAMMMLLGSAWVVMRSGLDDRVNSDIVQEIEEFRRFAAEARDRDHSAAGSIALVEAFMSGQRPGEGELLVGYHHTSGEMIHNPGPLADAAVLGEGDLFARMRQEPAGVATTAAGEVRWGRVDLSTPDGDGALFVVVFADRLHEDVAAMFRVMVPIALASTAVAGFVAWLVAGRLIAPVREVQRTAAEITERDLTRRLPVSGDDELADLAITFNAMLDRLETAFAAEHQFVDDAGHELRTPITIIRGHLELMGDDPAERRATIALVTRELDRMGRIVSDLLTLAKADRPDYVQLHEPVDMAQVTLDLDAHVAAIPDRLWVLEHVADGPAVVDRERVVQAVLQLASNAVQHTASGGRITLASRFTTAGGAPAVEFSVTDDGPGVPDSQKARVFDRFYRGGSSRDDSGAGLGLAIVAAIATGHGGTIRVEDAPAGGARFVLTLPTRLTPGNARAGEHDLEGVDA